MKTKCCLVTIFGFAIILLVQNNSYSQDKCETPEVSINTKGENLFNRYVIWFKSQRRHLNTDLKTIPLVIHVIYRNSDDSAQISWERIRGQLDTTNKQLRRLNASAKKTRWIFLPAAADCNIQVCLATKKPGGSSFAGVIYHNYPGYNPDDFRAVQAATILDPDRYLNVWVVPGQGGGGATMPWDKTANRDGFWIGAEWFGTIGSNLSYFMNGGTTFTHETAHYLGVWHSNHDGSVYAGACDRLFDGSISDFCADTPLDWQFKDGVAPECENGRRNECGRYITQTENFMYYNPDSCTNMFSRDQRARMRACLSGLRFRLASASNLVLTGVNCDLSPVPVFATNNVNNDEAIAYNHSMKRK